MRKCELRYLHGNKFLNDPLLTSQTPLNLHPVIVTPCNTIFMASQIVWGQIGPPIAVFSLGPHYKDIYFGILNRAAKSRFGPGEKHFLDPSLRADLLKILTLNPND